MTRHEAITILASRLRDAPNYEHYLAWLYRQETAQLIALATGQPVPGWRRGLEEVA